MLTTGVVVAKELLDEAIARNTSRINKEENLPKFFTLL